MNLVLKQSFWFISLLLFLVSCRVTLVPEYNSKLEDQVANAAKANDKLYVDMLDMATEKRKYDDFKDRYNEIEAEINSIKLKNEARNHNKDFIIINQNLKKAFDEAKRFHKDHVVLTDGQLKAYQVTIAGFWRPLYVAERGLKNQDAPSN